MKSLPIRVSLNRRELRQLAVMANQRGMRRPTFIAFELRENLLKPAKPVDDANQQTVDHAATPS
jgi:hypothetical protein